MADLAVGQKLWFVSSNNRRDEYEITVAKIGRKWIETGRGLRLDKSTLWADGGQYVSPGRAYVSRQAWDEEKALNAAWDALFQRIRNTYHRPEGVSVADIEAATALLFPALGETGGER